MTVVANSDAADEFSVEFRNAEVADFFLNILGCAGKEQTLLRITAEERPDMVDVGVVGVVQPFSGV